MSRMFFTKKIILDTYNAARNAISTDDFIKNILSKTDITLATTVLNEFNFELQKLVEQLQILISDSGYEKFITSANLALEGYLNADSLDEQVEAIRTILEVSHGKSSKRSIRPNRAEHQSKYLRYA